MTGHYEFCEDCAKAKAKAKAINKVTEEKATSAGERLSIDISGPFAPTIRGASYWGKVVDEYSNYSWSFFMKSKSEFGQNVIDLIKNLKAQEYKVKFVRCDNAGENRTVLMKYLKNEGILREFTSPNTPQQNGVVERRFTTDRTRATAMLLSSNSTIFFFDSLEYFKKLLLET